MTSPRIFYAIGDVHGEDARLGELHEILLEHHSLLHAGAAMTLVHLGDYIDRGPDSHGVIERLMNMTLPGEADQLIHLHGNHERGAVDSTRGDDESTLASWLKWGGEETLVSYRKQGHDWILPHHVDWMADLPVIHVEEEAKLIFVHAGVDPKRYPEDDEQVYLWSRKAKHFDAVAHENPALEGWTVVHGHTPTKDSEPEHVNGRRINIDTGAVYGGKLTAVCLAPDAQPIFLHA